MAKRQKMSEAGANNDWTILDFLNEDCWREVLRRVPARDVIRTERASRRWQEVVMRYLADVHISIIVDDGRKTKTDFNTCSLESSKYKSFEIWCSKLGSSVVAAYCDNWKSLATVKVNCPNLETLQLLNMPDFAPEKIPCNLNEDFKNLKRLLFRSCSISDHCVSQLIAEKAIEELEFRSCDDVTGQCLKTINSSNLKCLDFDSCRKLSVEHIVSSVVRLVELTQLKLNYIDYELAEEIQSVLDKMPKLERLVVYSDIRTSCVTFEPLARLARLKHLYVSIQLGNDGVEAVMTNCKELRTFVLDCEGMTSQGAETIARLGARLTSLKLIGFFELDDDGLVAIIRGCPKLKSLDVSGSSFLTPALPARAQAARRGARAARSLRLDLSYTNLEHDECLDNYEGQEYEDMKRLYEEMMSKYEDLVIVLGRDDYENDDDDDDDKEDSE